VGVPIDEAKKRYINLVDTLIKKYKLTEEGKKASKEKGEGYENEPEL
jgi:hypothetical protein